MKYLTRFVPWAIGLLAVACGGAKAPTYGGNVDSARSAGQRSTDGETVGQWLLYELVSKGGDVSKAKEARAKLEKLPHDGLYGSLARAIDDGGHGNLDSAADAYLGAIRASRSSSDPRAPLVAWFSTNHLLGLAPNVSGLWAKGSKIVDEGIEHPGSMGWRARGELVSWWTQEAYEAAQSGAIEASAQRHGCVNKVRLAGPFGHGAAQDRRRAFAAEQPGAWPLSFVADPGIHVAPRILKTERHGCQVRAT